MRKCIICGNDLSNGARKFCLKCKDEQHAKIRLQSQKAYFERLSKLDPIRKCKRCGEVKKHTLNCGICSDCNNHKTKKPSKRKQPEDLLFLSLINKARLNNHALSNKIRKSTVQESEELWLQRSVSSVSRVVEKALQ